jgi:hypothetical protein
MPSTTVYLSDEASSGFSARVTLGFLPLVFLRTFVSVNERTGSLVLDCKKVLETLRLSGKEKFR